MKVTEVRLILAIQYVCEYPNCHRKYEPRACFPRPVTLSPCLDKVTATGNCWHFFVIREYVGLKWRSMLLVQLLRQRDQLDVL